MATGATYTPIFSTTLGSAQASVTFSSIPQTYTDLVLISNSVLGATAGFYQIQVNSDTATNYSRTRIVGNGTTATSSRDTSSASIAINDLTSNFENSIVSFMNYANTTTYKTILIRSNNTSVYAMVGLWRSTAAITTINILTNAGTFGTGSTFTLYGIAAA